MTVCVAAAARMPEKTADQYEGISERNLFGLKGQPQSAPEPAQVEAPTKLFLTGITTILGAKRVLLKEQAPAGSPAGPKQDQSLILAEGQREGGVEVLQIDPKAGKVKVNNSGVIQTLTFDRDGIKAPAAPAAPPPLPTTSSAPFPLPGPVQPGQSRHTLPTRTPRWPGTANAGAAAASATAPTTGGSIFPAAPTPTGSPSGQPEAELPGTVPSEIQNQQQPELSLEQQVMMELQQEGQQNNTGAPGTPAASNAAGTGSAPAVAPGVTAPGGLPANDGTSVYPQ